MILYNEDLQNLSIVFEIVKVALENKMSSDIVGRDLDVSDEELDRIYKFVTEKLS
jgi:hypothetical protein